MVYTLYCVWHVFYILVIKTKETIVSYVRSGVAEVDSGNCIIGMYYMFVISHVSMYLPWIYPRVLAGSFEERIAVLIDLQLLLELTTSKGKRIKSTSKTIRCNVHDYFDQQLRNKIPLHPSNVRRLLKPHCKIVKIISCLISAQRRFGNLI